MKNINEEQLTKILTDKGLNYEVGTINIPDPFTNEASDFFATYRKDSQKIFTMGLSKHFTPIQNVDAFKFLTDMSQEREFDVVSGGSFKDGASVYMQLGFGESDIGDGDKVGNFLTVVNSHDGSKAMNIILTPYRFFCKNQIAPAMRNVVRDEEAGKRVRIILRHTAGATIAMERLTQTLTIANNQFEDSVKVYKNLARTKIDENMVGKALAKMFPKPDELSKKANTIWNTNIENVRARFLSADNGQIERYTAWNLYNSIQGTFQHDGRNSSNHLQSTLMGAIAEKSSLSLDVVRELVGV